MKIVRFSRADGLTALGIVTEEEIVSLEGVFSSFKDLFSAAEREMLLQQALEQGRRYNRAVVSLQAPLGPDAVVFAVAANYMKHAAEMGVKVPEHPIIFNKFFRSMIGPDDNIVLPPYAQQVDYEGELAVMIGKGGYALREEEAMEYVGGYTCFNDITARDKQWTMLGDRRIIDWFSGKAAQSSTPIGPWIVLKEGISDPHNLHLQTRVNGKIVQDENTAAMVFKIPALLAYISSRVSLQPGDIIATGTPVGVGGHGKEIILQPGDRVDVEIEKIGVLSNRCVSGRNGRY